MFSQPCAVLLSPVQGPALVHEQLFDDQIAVLEDLHLDRIGRSEQHAPHVAGATPEAPEDTYTRTLVWDETGHVAGDSFKNRV